MHGYYIHEGFYLNCGIYDPGTGVQDPWVGPVWPHTENVLI